MNSDERCLVYIKKLEVHFLHYADAGKSRSAKKYLLNQFEFFGIDTPQRRSITRRFLADVVVPDDIDKLVRLLWKREQREFQYFAMELLEAREKKEVIDLGLIEFMITNKSWWDTVDFISPKLAGGMLRMNATETKRNCLRWIKSDNMWLRRTALLCQMKYKDKTNEALLFTLVKKCANEKEFFIRKAIGWALREYSKTNPEAVKQFVNLTHLSNLSRKEALKRMQLAETTKRRK